VKSFPSHSVVHSRREGLCSDVSRSSATLFGQNDRTLNRRTLRKDLQFSFRHGEFRETTMQTDHELRKNPHDGFVETFDSAEMDGNFAVEHALLIGLASFAGHEERNASVTHAP
jgi:hypothetical protein